MVQRGSAARQAHGAGRSAARLHSVKRAARRPVVVRRVTVAAPLVTRVLAPVFFPRVSVAAVVTRVVVAVRVVRGGRVRRLRAVARVLGPVVVVLTRVAALIPLGAARVVVLLQPLRPRRAGPAACRPSHMLVNVLNLRWFIMKNKTMKSFKINTHSFNKLNKEHKNSKLIGTIAALEFYSALALIRVLGAHTSHWARTL